MAAVSACSGDGDARVDAAAEVAVETTPDPDVVEADAEVDAEVDAAIEASEDVAAEVDEVADVDEVDEVDAAPDIGPTCAAPCAEGLRCELGECRAPSGARLAFQHRTVCAVDGTDRAYCWGSNVDQVVDQRSSAELVTTPMRVGVDLDIVEVALDEFEGFLRRRNGDVMRWGPSPVAGGGVVLAPPTKLELPFEVAQVVPIASDLCFRDTRGQVHCGNGGVAADVYVTIPYPDAVSAVGITKVVAVRGGEHFAEDYPVVCALSAVGDVYCSYLDPNYDGAMYDAAPLRPVRVARDVADLAASIWIPDLRYPGYNARALTLLGTDGGLRWLDLDALRTAPKPITFAAASPLVRLYSNVFDSDWRELRRNLQLCAIDAAGAVVCWEEEPPWSAAAAAPVVIDAVGDAAEVAIGAGSACLRTAAGEVRCWGYGYCGELTRPPEEDPEEVSCEEITWAFAWQFVELDAPF